MTGRPPLPWWKRRQATLVAEAARRTGHTATARLDGWLEIRDADGASVAEAQFNQDTGAIIRASGRTTDVTPTTGRSFRKDGVAYFTPREVADAFVAWISDGRRAEYDARAFVAERRVREARKMLGIPDPEDDPPPAATVTDITTRRKR